MFEAEGERSKTVMCRYLSRNTQKATMGATEEERLVEIITELTDELEKDLEGELDAEEDDIQILYPKFYDMLEKKAEKFKGDSSGHRQICCVPSFVLALSMAGRLGRHYKHCRWFTTVHMRTIVGQIGGVSFDEWNYNFLIVTDERYT